MSGSSPNVTDTARIIEPLLHARRDSRDRGDTAAFVVRLSAHLMAGARRGARTRGKSDPIDATAIARAALREGVQNLKTARLAGPDREIRQLALYRERLLDMRTRLSNELRWQLHDLWPDWEIPAKAFAHPGWQTKIQSRLAHAEQTIQVQIARDMIRRIRELSRATKTLYDKLAALVKEVAPQLLAEPGIGVLLAAKLIGEASRITGRVVFGDEQPRGLRSRPPASSSSVLASPLVRPQGRSDENPRGVRASSHDDAHSSQERRGGDGCRLLAG